MSEPFQFGPWTWGDEGKPKPEYKEPTGRHLCCGMDAEMKPFAQGDWVPYHEYHSLFANSEQENARLKAEVERLKGIILAQSSEFVRNATKHEEPLPDGWNSGVARAVDLLAEKEKEIALLKAKVEQLNDAITRGAIIPDAKPE